MSIQLTPALEQSLQHLAAQSNTTADDVAQHALEDFVAFRRELDEAVKQSDEDIKTGRLLEHRKVVTRMGPHLGHRETFLAAVREGIAAGDRGELVEHDEVVAMIDDIIAHG
jgi:predicted transcriptional regulator